MEVVRFSVIIPVYNSELYLRSCLDSVFSQTYPVYEVILFNDGSVDNSESIIFEYMKLYNNIRYDKHENQGQGATRNKLIKMVTGDYIVILDSDDMLEDITLEKCAQCIKNDTPDIINFEFKLLKANGKTEYNFVNLKYSGKDILYNEECITLLTNKAYYTCTNVYSKMFLLENNIYYSEGHIYEDHEFYIKSCLCAKKISIIHSPLYIYRIHENATTKNNYKTSVHYKAELKAFEKAINLIYTMDASEQAKAYITNHSFLAFLNCLWVKTPSEYKIIFIKKFVDLMRPLIFQEEKLLNKGFRIMYKNRSLYNKNYFYIMCFIYYLRLLYILNKFNKAKIKQYVKGFSKSLYLNIFSKSPLLNNTILFIGFDNRYTGNSKYLYEQMKMLYPQYKYFYVTQDNAVPENERIKKGSKDYYYYLACAKIIILESNDLYGIFKRDGQIRIQMWHATTIKKLLFDSSEPYTNKKSPYQKIIKFKLIQDWDYFITECHYIAKYYRSCFLLKDIQIKNLGYPRVKYLVDNKSNYELINKIKKSLDISIIKKIILYAPTWRDYNYVYNNFEYLLDLNLMSFLLGDDYIILFKDHDFIKKTDDKCGNFINVNNKETQELILISDFIISDYSSIIFDGVAIDIPFFIYANDKNIYENARGVYDEIYCDISKWEVIHEYELCNKIKNYKYDNRYSFIKQKYTHIGEFFALPEFIASLIEK